MKDSTAASDKSVVLVVDLDGTLSRTDTMHEALAGYLGRQPLKLPSMAQAALGNRATFKARLAEEATVVPEALLYSEAVIERVKAARDAGRKTALVSASDHRQVQAVADHLGLFDDVIGTGSEGTDGVNLSGAAKAAYLVERYGENAFDYFGDAAVDVPVWKAARAAVSVNASPRVRAAAEAANENIDHIDPRPDEGLDWRALFKAMRPHQWSKNALVFLPVLAAHDAGGIFMALVAFIAFSLTASSVYLINDILDLADDRAHPRKRNRPFASGALPVSVGAMAAPVLVLVAILLSLVFTPPAFLSVLALYYAVTFAYSIWIKKRLIADIVTLAGLYTIRILGGAAAAAVTLSPWMLGFSIFIFTSLAAVKRQAELVDLAERGKTVTSGRGYEVGDLPIVQSLALGSGIAGILVLALYISSDAVQQLYDRPEILWFMCPVLLYWSTRMVMKAHRGQMPDDPIIFAATDRISQISILICAGVVVLAAVW